MVTAVTAIPVQFAWPWLLKREFEFQQLLLQKGLAIRRDLQMEVILSLVMGKDVFAILPTGYGKSLCYASLPLLLDHLYQPTEKSIVIVVTPLTAIMEDQASQMKQSCCIN